MVANRKGQERVKGFKSLSVHDAAMGKEGDIVTQSFERHSIRRVIYRGVPYFSVIDVCEAVAEPTNPRRYWSDLKRQLAEKEGFVQLYEKIVQLKLRSSDGKTYATDCADFKTVLRIVQSIPSPKAEPFKEWLSQLGFERVEEKVLPARGIKRAVERARKAYREDGRPEDWIDNRLQNISAENELKDEWGERDVPEKSWPVIENKMHEEALGISRKDHRKLKSLHADEIELPDHMDPVELAIDTLSKVSAKAIVSERDTEGVEQTHSASVEGAKIAGDARRALEKKLGRPVPSKTNYLRKPDKKAELPAPKIKRK